MVRNKNKFKYKTKDTFGAVSPSTGGWYNEYPTVEGNIYNQIALYEPTTMEGFIILVIDDESPIFGRQRSVLVDMQTDVHNNTITALSYLQAYLYTAKIAVDDANSVISNHEVTQVSNAMKKEDQDKRAAKAGVKTFAEWQEDIDNVRIEYDASAVRCKAIKWLAEGIILVRASWRLCSLSFWHSCNRCICTLSNNRK